MFLHFYVSNNLMLNFLGYNKINMVILRIIKKKAYWLKKGQIGII